MNLAFLLFNYFPFGGLERDFMAISRECLKKGNSVDVFTMKWEGDRPHGMNITIIPVSGLTNHGRIASFVKKLPAHFNRASYDLVMGFNRVPGLDVYFAADICYVSRIKTGRSSLSRLTPRYRLLSEYEKNVFSTTSKTHIIYLSSQQKKDYQKIYFTPEERFSYAPPGVDKKRIQSYVDETNRITIRNEFNLTNEDTFLLMVGSNFHTKGVSRSIAALASLPHEMKTKTFLFVIGKGNIKKYSKLAKSFNIDNQVHFLGGREDVPRFYAGADFLLQPSLAESAGNVIVESLVAGLPVLTTDTCGYAEHVKKAAAGMICSGSPFIQENFNSILYKMLSSTQKHEWSANALNYSAHTDLYNRPKIVADLITKISS